MDTKLFERYAVLDDQKKQLEDKLKEIKEEQRQISQQIIEQSMEEGVDKVTVVVGHKETGEPIRRTVYRVREVWASSNGSQEELNEALKEAGLNEYVQEKVNTNSLSAYVRGFDPNQNLSPEEIVKALPEPLQDKVKVSEVLKIKSRLP